MDICPICGREFRTRGLGRHRGAKTSKCPYTEAERAMMDEHWAEVRRASAIQWRRDNPERATANDKLHTAVRKKRRQRRRKNRVWRRANPGYYTAYRQANLEARRASERAWKAANPDRVREQKRRWTKSRVRSSTASEPLLPLFPDLVSGTVYSFWDEELSMDLRQEAFLAELEGKDAKAQCRKYRYREREWFRNTTALFEETNDAYEVE